ncbi:MAG: hypothetical protein LCH66_09800 [Actinobacteria bacterium]|jgi:type IV secretory pathway TrbL component|nr:hypothetical protein [Actinomycetota bacterium]
MSKRTFWIGLAAVTGALLLLPALLVGLLAIANGLTAGNEQLVRAGGVMAGLAAMVGGILWWLIRRRRAD